MVNSKYCKEHDAIGCDKHGTLNVESLSNVLLDLKVVRSRIQGQHYRAAEMLLETVIRIIESSRGGDR